MEKLFVRGSYWLGTVCLVIAVIWRAANAFGIWMPQEIMPGKSIGYLPFFHGSMLFFGMTIATACYAWMNSQKP